MKGARKESTGCIAEQSRNVDSDIFPKIPRIS